MSPFSDATWPPSLDDLRFSPSRSQPADARQFRVLANGHDIGTLHVRSSGWRLALRLAGELVEHEFIAADEDAALDAGVLSTWAVLHVLQSLEDAGTDVVAPQ